jgi:hypothetical protein
MPLAVSKYAEPKPRTNVTVSNITRLKQANTHFITLREPFIVLTLPSSSQWHRVKPGHSPFQLFVFLAPTGKFPNPEKYQRSRSAGDQA